MRIATPPEGSDHHQTDTADGQTEVSSGQFQASSLPNHLTYGVSWRSGAGELLLVRIWRRRTLDAMAHRMRDKDDVSFMVSVRPGFGERKTQDEVVSNRQTNCCGHHEKARVGQGGCDSAVVVREPARARDSGTAPITLAGTPLQGKKFSPGGRNYCRLAGRDTESKRSRNWLWNGTSPPLDRRHAPGQGGVDPRWCERQTETGTWRRGACAADVADHHDDRISPEQGEFPQTPTGVGRRCLHDSDGSNEDVDHNLGSFGILEGENDALNPVSNVGTRSGMASARGRNKPEVTDKLLREQPMASGQKRQ